ncbi:MAG: HAMP domain-containing histidine kinase [Chloroflexi bacterium]|nr:HAMP domain-containing histidine kinase [Chloroflexota bacterium]
MSEPYSQELRSDTSEIVIPVISALTIVAGLLAGVASSVRIQDSWHFWVIALLAFGGGLFSWRLVKGERARAGATFFVSLYLFLITLLLTTEWQPGSPIPYFFGVLIIISSMIYSPRAGFYTWGISIILSVIGVTIRVGGFDFLLLLRQLAAPTTINFLVALAAYLTALEWEYAVESISGLHIRVQQRRDELFAAKKELDLINAKQRFTNQQLDAARQEAIKERDLRTRFMNNVSHELRTPLNGIVNFAHILAQGGQGPVNDGQADYLDRIEKSGWHLLAVLNDLLDMAQIEAGEFKLHMELVNLHNICEDAMRGIRGLILNKPVELVRDYPDEWPFVNVDKMRLKQALINLLGNAEKYTEAGYIALRVKPEGETVRIIVEDSGIGIAPEDHEKIFREFHQVNEQDARRRIGTGLGLPITRHLVEKHGGAISVSSEVGRGTAFIITLPAAANSPSPNGQAKPNMTAVAKEAEANVPAQPAAVE